MNRSELLATLRREVAQAMPDDGYLFGRLPGVAFTRASAPQKAHQCFYQPMVALVLQGRKQSLIGGVSLDYGPGEAAVVALDLPGVYHITNAAPDAPFLSVSLRLDRQIIADLLTQMPAASGTAAASSATVIQAAADTALLDAFLRLSSLASAPEDVAVMAPLLTREIHYRLLTGPMGDGLRRFCANEAQTPQVVKSIVWLREHFREPIDIAALASMAAMAPSTFHKHFKALTSLSPIQFQKRLRLHEAQRLMLSEGKNVEAASYAVGYESASQFSREYKRLFGAAPGNDISRRKTAD